MRMRKKPNLLPRMEKCTHVNVTSPEGFRGIWLDVFGGDELYLELGCGKGRFTAELAQTIPSKLLVAVERVPEAMVVAMERVCEANLENVRFTGADVKMLPEMFAPGEASRIYINFCDPWPSRRNEKKRLTSPGFLDLYRAVLKDGGEIHFKTDNQELFTYSLRQFEDCGFSVSEATRDLHADGIKGILTNYEEKFLAEGKPICRLVAVKEAL